MRSKHWQVCIAAAAAIILITACNGGGGQSVDPTATLFVIPTLSPTQMLTQPAAEAAPDVLDRQNLDSSALDSYASTFEMSWSGVDESSQPIEGSYHVSTDFRREPYVRGVRWSSSATAVPDATFELIEIGDEAWMIIGDATDTFCLSGSRDELGAQDAPYSPDTWLAGSDLSELHRVLPDEDVNGIRVQHYQMTEADLASFAGYSDYTLDVWVDTATGVLVRQSLIADGAFADFATGSGHLEWTYDLRDVNSRTPEVAPPATCEGG